jgi:hypothetical protein
MRRTSRTLTCRCDAIVQWGRRVGGGTQSAQSEEASDAPSSPPRRSGDSPVSMYETGCGDPPACSRPRGGHTTAGRLVFGQECRREVKRPALR